MATAGFKRVVRGTVLRRGRRSAASGGVVMLSSVALIAAAFTADGFHNQRTEARDGSVWVTNKVLRRTARVNTQIKKFDASLNFDSAAPDVHQQADVVLLHDMDGSTLRLVNVRGLELSGAVKVPKAAQVAFGGEHGREVVAFVDQEGGFFALRAAEVGSFDIEKAEPLLRFGAGTRASVADDGAVSVVDPVAGTVSTMPAVDLDKANEEAAKKAAAAEDAVDDAASTTTSVAAGTTTTAVAEAAFALEPEVDQLSPQALGEVQIASVGRTAVVLDRTAARVYVAGKGSTDLSSLGEGLQLQLSGAGTAAYVASDSGLGRVPLAGGGLQTLSTAGTGGAARPAVHGACLMAAWAGRADAASAAPVYLDVCEGTAVGDPLPISGGKAGVPVSVRVNRESAAINDDEGRVLAQGAPITNWDQVQPPPPEEDNTDQSSEDAPTEDDAKPDRSGKNQPPQASDDDLGVRPGRATVLDVLHNDQDRNGDVLTIVADSVKPIDPALGRIDLVNGGQALQFTPAPGRVDGQATFTYVATDGIANSVSEPARVTMSIHPWSVNAKPALKNAKKPSKTTASLNDPNGVQHDVLVDWIDPDGDVLSVTGASVAPADGVARFHPSGVVTFIPQGSMGQKSVDLTVSDGAEEATGQLIVTVTDSNVAPRARNDFAIGFVGKPVILRPLANDSDANSDEMRLLAVTPEDPSVQVSGDSITVSSDAPRTFILDYRVGDTPSRGGSPLTTDGVIRVDVRARGDGGAPVAVLDATTVTVGRPSVIEVLANDADPDDDVLVLTSALPTETRPDVDVAVVDNRAVRVLAKSTPADKRVPLIVTYRINDGRNEVEGSLVVQVLDRPAKDQPPIARADEVTVRAGDVVTVPVLVNDLDPEGGPLTLEPTSVALTTNPPIGTVFASGANVRFVAPAKAGRITAEYSVLDEAGQKAGTQVAFDVKDLPKNPATDDAPPQPLALEARGFAGSKSIEIKVPLDGVDPDGDSVRLVGDTGLGTVAPKYGRLATSPDGRTVVYEPDRNFVGTEELTYAVVDPFGKTGEAPLRIGIVPRPAQNRAPVVGDDKVMVRPGTRIAVPALVNDADPDGDVLSIESDSLALSPVDAATDLALGAGNTITLTAPVAPGTAFVTYAVSDGQGGRATGVITVVSDPAATGLAPRPVDDDGRAAKLELGQTTLDLDVRVNDTDPDTAVDELTVGFPATQDPTVAVAGAAGHAVFTLVDREQVLAYTLTDPQGNVGTAVVRVPPLRDPAKENKAPVLRDGRVAETPFEQPLVFDVNDVAVDPEGKPLKLTSSARISGSHGAGVASSDGVTLTFTPEGQYAGQASITFEVADGTLPADGGTGMAAILTLPVTVLPKENQPPTARPGTMTPGQGDAAAKLNLRELVDDPDPDDVPKLTITEPKGDLSGMKLSFDDGIVSLEAPADVKKGTTARLTYTVTDGESEPVSSTIDVTVQASAQPLPKAVDDTVSGKLSRGKPTTIQPLVNDFNPFAAQGKPLKIVAAEVAPLEGTVTTSESSITFTPDAKYSGLATIRYQIQDATGDADRAVWGQITAPVIGKPDKPQPPGITEVRSHTAVLQWLAPAMNGGDFKSYEVQIYDENNAAFGGPRSVTTTTATIDGLKNAPHTYTFTVTAVNEDGPSDPSERSAVAKPDQKLPKMGAPTLTFVAGTTQRLDVAWTAADASDASAPTQYQLDIVPAPPGYSGPIQLGPTQLTYTANGLTNGTAYQMRIAAVNDSGLNDFSDLSAPETPSAVPDPVGAPTATRVNDPLGGRIAVQWAAPNPNGAAITAYTIEVSRGGVVEKEVPVANAATSQEVTVASIGAAYQFRVKATNRSGVGAYGAQSAPVTNYKQPDPVTAVTAQPHDGFVTLVFADPASNGQAITKYVVNVYANNALVRTDNIAPATRNIGGLANGTSYSFDVTPWNTYPAASASPRSNATVPFGPPPAPSVSTSRPSATTVRFDWAPTGNNGNALTDIQYSLNGGGWTSAGPNPNGITVGNGFGQSYNITVRAVNAAGPGPQSGLVGNSTDPPPQPVVTIGWGGSAQGQPGCSSIYCKYVQVSVANFPANTQVSITCRQNGTGYFGPYVGFTTNGSGSGSHGDGWCYNGTPGASITVIANGVGSNSISP